MQFIVVAVEPHEIQDEKLGLDSSIPISSTKSLRFPLPDKSLVLVVHRRSKVLLGTLYYRALQSPTVTSGGPDGSLRASPKSLVSDTRSARGDPRQLSSRVSLQFVQHRAPIRTWTSYSSMLYSTGKLAQRSSLHG